MIGLVITIMVIIFLTYKPLISFYKPLVYEDSIVHFSEKNAKQISTIFVIKIKAKTKKAFLPYEKIRFQIKLHIFNEELIKLLVGKNISFVILNNNAKLKNTKDLRKYQENAKGNFLPSNPVAEFLTPESESPSSVFLNVGNPNSYFTELDVYFTKPGIYQPHLISGKDLVIPIKYELEIGSSIDVMNKRTNDLLYVLTVVSLLLSLYAQFHDDIRKFIQQF